MVNGCRYLSGPKIFSPQETRTIGLAPDLSHYTCQSECEFGTQ